MNVKNAEVRILSINLIVKAHGDGVESNLVTVTSDTGAYAVSLRAMRHAITIAAVVEKLWAEESQPRQGEVA